MPRKGERGNMSCPGPLYYWQVDVREYKHRYTSIALQNSIISLLPFNHHFQHSPSYISEKIKVIPCKPSPLTLFLFYQFCLLKNVLLCKVYHNISPISTHHSLWDIIAIFILFFSLFLCPS